MGIAYSKVAEIKSGDPILSNHLAALGNAVNQRLRSGLGDPTYRLVYYADSFARQIRNPDESQFLWPSRSEWLEVYATINPVDAQWSVAEAGTAEGINKASIAGEWVFGSQPQTSIEPEDERLLAVPMWAPPGDHPPATAKERWEIGKAQRGGWDPANGALGCPVFDAARKHFAMTRGTLSMHGKSWGGFAPTPGLMPDDNCHDGDSQFAPTPNYELFFSKIGDPATKITFPGTCPNQPGHVAFIQANPPFEYVVGVWDATGTQVVKYVQPDGKPIAFNEWIEGPYEGGNILTKQNGEHLHRVLNHFAAQYRGTNDQRAVVNTWNVHAFDTQRFLETQYLLAPARGTTSGASINVVYPKFELTWSATGQTNIPAGTKLPMVAGGTGSSFTVAQKCVVISLLVESFELESNCTIEVLSDGVRVALVQVSPTKSIDVLVLSAPIAAGKKVEMRVVEDVTFKAINQSTGVSVEVAEVMAYKPWVQDHWLLMRLSGCHHDNVNGMDGWGGDEQAAKLIGTDYFRWGCIQNLRGYASPPGSFAEINTNAGYEAGRRLFRCVRILRPEQLVSYEVTGGKSILVFNRWTTGSGGSPPVWGPGGTPPAETEVQSGDITADARYTVRAVGDAGSNYVTYNGTDYSNLDGFRGVASVPDFTVVGTGKVYLVTQYLPDSELGGATGDCLAGIAPDPGAVPTGQIRWKRNYKVWGNSGKVTYNDQEVNPGQTFQGVQNKTDFSTSGDAVVYELDGIKHTAEPENFTNEWLVGFQFKGFNNKAASIWKPDAYGRFFSFSERCHFYPNSLSLSMTDPRDVMAMRQFAYGDNIWLAPEAPTGYRLALGLNQKFCDESDTDCITRKKNFYKSCRLYEPDLEIESVELVDAPTGDLVKVTMKGRFHYDPDTAPASFLPNPNTWNLTALRNEPYRTTDNALREWLYHKATGINPSIKVGDSAENSNAYTQIDAPYGTVLPHIFFTKLIPIPYADNNNIQDHWDTPFLHDQFQMLELYLRVICEGFVDGKTSAELGCQTGISAIYDYTFQNLCFDAFEGKWFPPVPGQPTSLIESLHTRGDFPQGFGPLPNTIAAAETYNNFAKAINKLVTVRVMLPSKFQQRELRGEEYQSVIATNPDGSYRPCESKPGLPGVIYEGIGPDPTPTPYRDWEDAGDPPAIGTGYSWDYAIDNATQAYTCDGDKWVIWAVRTSYNFRWTLTDPDAYLAIPESWRSQLDADGSFLAHFASATEVQIKETGPYEGSTDCLGSPGWWPVATGVYLRFPESHPVVQDVCQFFNNSGTIHAPTLPGQVLPGGYNLGPCTYSVISSATLTPIPNDGIAFTVPLV
jgi:hypothetical protein